MWSKVKHSDKSLENKFLQSQVKIIPIMQQSQCINEQIEQRQEHENEAWSTCQERT